jgi:23S rRNA pseudouridine1911/1915/1917 synthase
MNGEFLIPPNSLVSLAHVCGVCNFELLNNASKMPLETRHTTVTDADAGRLDLIVGRLCERSRSQVRGLVDHDCVSVNHQVCHAPARTLSPGDVVTVQFDPTQGYHEKKSAWKDRTFDVIFEDEHLIVVNKMAGSLTVPTDANESNCLVDRVGVYLSHGRRRRPAWVVHRLDRDVSGLLVFGKQERIAESLIEQFCMRKPKRVYVAIVAGRLLQPAATLEGHLATGKNLDRFLATPSRETELAITHYRTLQELSDATVVEVQLETGRRNQIRVQFAGIGHPVLGDPRYKKQQARHPHWDRRRMALHAKTLGFMHPVTGEAMTFDSPLPTLMEKFIAGDKRRRLQRD